jgi:dihydroorotase
MSSKRESSRHDRKPGSSSEQLGTEVLIAGARIIDPSDGFDAEGYLGLRDGRIVWRSTEKPRDKYAETIEAQGHWLLPGLVDLSARLREPGATQKGTIRSETLAAAAGGITTLCLPPDTKPIMDHPSVLDRVRGIVAASGSGVHVAVLGALTQGLGGEAIAEMSALRDAGCVGVSPGAMPLGNLALMRRALEYAHGLGLTVHVVPMDRDLGAGGCAHDGPVATRLGLPPIPVAAEVAAIRSWISLVEDTGARVHFGRLSSARGVELIASAKQRRLPVTADVAIHQLLLSEHDLVGFNALCHVLPPLRATTDRDALRAAVRDGTIDAICTDHQPHEPDAKIDPFPWTEPGISGLDTLLPLALELVRELGLPPLALAQRLSRAPARILGAASCGLHPDDPADFILVDPALNWQADRAQWRSAGRNSPFLNASLSGRCMASFVAGRRIFPAPN